MKRTVSVVTTSRADYSLLYWPLRELTAHPEIDLRLIALGPHLSPEFGLTVQEIERDGFKVDARIECLLSSDTDVAMAKTIGIATQSLADYFGRLRPDLLLLTADRYEMLAPAAVALALRIPIAHVEGGEVSEGAIDDCVRNALTKLSHIHFTSTALARARVIAMGEEEWRVHQVGAPALEHLRRSSVLGREELESRLGIDLTLPTAIVTFHPITIARDTTREADALFKALESVSGQLLFCYPNADAGSRSLIRRLPPNAKTFVNLEPAAYWSLLGYVDLLIGNSSSGIIEAASFELPVVNIGIRQQGRERGRNVLDADATVESILAAIEAARGSAFRQSLRGMENPYGDGRSAAKIAEVLANIELGEKRLIKKAPHLRNT